MFGRVTERTLPVLASGCPLPFYIAIGPIAPYLFLGLHHSQQGQMPVHRFICPHYDNVPMPYANGASKPCPQPGIPIRLTSSRAASQAPAAVIGGEGP